MAIPTELQELITAGLVKVKSDPNHDVNLGYREAIYSALGSSALVVRNGDKITYPFGLVGCDRREVATAGRLVLLRLVSLTD